MDPFANREYLFYMNKFALHKSIFYFSGMALDRH